MGNVSLCWCCSPCCSVPLGVTYSVPLSLWNGPSHVYCSLLFLRVVWSLSSAMPQWRTEKSIHTSRQGQICLFSVADWYTAFTLQLLEHRDIFPSNLPQGWWSLWEGRAGVSCSFSAPSTTCQRSSKLAVVHISGRHWGLAVPSVLFVTLRISPAVLHLGSGAAFSVWVWLHG